MDVVFVLVAIVILLLALPSESFGLSVGQGLGMGKLSASQIAQYAANAGFTGNDLATAVSIALAESGGNPKAVGDLGITPGGSVGLWQINLKYHPEFAGEDLTDPQTNANAAYSVYAAAGFSFHPWSTFKSGANVAYLADAQAAAGEVA